MSDQKNTPALKFRQIYEKEQAEIAKRRGKQFYIQEDGAGSQLNCVGLALSGGGIRSATFCLGFLQELNRLKLLRIIDYLSTVSGGGYVGGWWSAWLSRDEKAIRSSGDPLLERRNIHNASSLVARIADGNDEISEHLREQIRDQDNHTYRLLTKYNDGEQPSNELLNKLIAQLNVFIKTFVPAEDEKSQQPDLIAATSEPEAETKALDQKKARELEKKRQWANRFRLEEAFPYELRNNFPPDELIEPDRQSKDKEDSEGSLHAYRDPVHHLRLFANYLTPRKGMLSADTWRAVATIARNLTLTWLILLPVLVTVMFLGQAYLLLNPLTRTTFENPGQQPDLIFALAPLAVLISLTVVTAIGWLICNRETTSGLDWLVQGVCLLALLSLLASGLYSFKSNLIAIDDFTKVHWISLGVWAGMAAILMIVIWFWGINKKIGVDDPETLARWKKEVRRNRFSRAQARLLVTTTVVGIVLLVSWACTFPYPSSPIVNVRIAIIPVLSIAGSIFTAFRAKPTAAADRSRLREPAFLSRVVFAITPPMVLVVLAACAGFVANRLLKAMVLSCNAAQVPYILYVSAMLFVALCAALAVYEMKEVKWSRIVEPSVSATLFTGLGVIVGSWFIQAMLYSQLHQDWYRQLLFWASMVVAVVIVVFVLVRVFPSENWKAQLLDQLEQAKEQAKEHASSHAKLRARSLAKRFDALLERVQDSLTSTAFSLIGVLIIVGWWIGNRVYIGTQGATIFRGVILSVVGISGGVIVYRLFLVRKAAQSRFYFEFRWPRGKTFLERPEPRWILAALCLIVPVVLVCLSHKLIARHEQSNDDNLYLLFPLGLIALTAVLILLRSLVVESLARKCVDERLAGKDSYSNKVRPFELQKGRALLVLAICALLMPIIAEPVSRTIWSPSTNSILDLKNVDLIVIGAMLLLNFPIFAVALFRLEPSPHFKISCTFKKWNWMYSRFVLWLLAFFSIVIALVVGVLLHEWLKHVSEVPLGETLIPILLPGAVACFLLVLVEMYWGEGENRRGLWLITLAYIGFASIFFFSLETGSRTVFYAEVILGLLAAVVVWIVALGWMVDPNAVAMHQFYKGRLVRAYLGASNVRRNRHGKKEITETVAGDDLVLESLHNCDRGGPYHIINTTLNLVGGRDLATAQRSASSFTLSQGYCGSGRTDYRPTTHYMSGLLSLGTAVAASGAAVSPNMGSKKPTAALAMLMTLLNVRLGYWAPTPSGEAWRSSQPRLWPLYLLREFFSQTNDVGTYCYLTDGGHFDNTGLYSLIERGCRYIILVDCGADPKPSCFQDLGEAIRRCRIDFGTEIDLSLDSLVNVENDRGCVFGRIRFSAHHLRALLKESEEPEDSESVDEGTGIIIYVKPTVVPSVTADVRQYSLENNFFPQQTTANQWFDEAQFESYRRLGQFCANKIFDIDAVQNFARVIRPSNEALQTIFNELEMAWVK